MRYAVVCLLGLVFHASAAAGIYNTVEVDDIRLSTDILQFRDILIKVRTIGFDKVDFENLLRKRYLFYEALAGDNPPKNLTLEQKLDYSAVLLRRRKFQQAIEFLTPLVREHPDIFLFESHLAMAYWGSGQTGNDRRAVEHLSNVLSKRGWVEDFHQLSDKQRDFFENSMGWNEGPYLRYREFETYLLKLWKLRMAEKAGEPFEAVDALFGDAKSPVKFVNPEGVFEPGRISTIERAKLDRSALEIVEQLLLWLPEDLRLYWLLGEIANARWSAADLKLDPAEPKNAARVAQAFNDLKAANLIFKELADDFGVRAKELRERRQILREFVQSVETPQETLDTFEDKIKKAIGDDDPPMLPASTRTLAITFAAGLAVGLFALWQFQEIRRRRRGG